MCLSPQSDAFQRSMEKLVEMSGSLEHAPSTALDYLLYSEVLWNVRDLQATVRALDAAMAGSPPLSAMDLSKAYASRSICFLQMGDFERALEDATSSVEMVPRAHPYGLRAITLMTLGRIDEALADVEEAARIDPEDWEVRAWRGNVYLELGRYAEAIAEYDWVLGTGECHRYASELYRGRARALLQLQRPAEAVDDASKAIDEDHHEQSHWPFIVRGRMREAHLAYLLRAEASLQMGAVAKALGDCYFAASIAPAEAAVYDLRARVWEAAGNLQESIHDLIRAEHLRRPATDVADGAPPEEQRLLVAAGA